MKKRETLASDWLNARSGPPAKCLLTNHSASSPSSVKFFSVTLLGAILRCLAEEGRLEERLRAATSEDRTERPDENMANSPAPVFLSSLPVPPLLCSLSTAELIANILQAGIDVSEEEARRFHGEYL